MLSTRNRGGAVKAEIPQALYMSIVRLQATETLGWENACARAAGLLDVNSQEFKHAAELEAQRLYKVRFMKELNKGRESIREGALGIGFEAGHDDALSSIFNLDEKDVSKYGLGYAACPHCGKPLSGALVNVKNSFGTWVLDKIREGGWGHPACQEKAKTAT
jgi:hypothetical protein